jgi:hypothetical protein
MSITSELLLSHRETSGGCRSDFESSEIGGSPFLACGSIGRFSTGQGGFGYEESDWDGGLECCISCLCLIYPNRSFKPPFWIEVIWSASGHGGYRISDLRIKPSSEFYNYSFWSSIPGI